MLPEKTNLRPETTIGLPRGTHKNKTTTGRGSSFSGVAQRTSVSVDVPEKHGRRMSVISCTKRHVYEALVKTQAEGTPEYLRVSEALVEPDSETSELMRTLYFSETLGFHEAHRASLALTT